MRLSTLAVLAPLATLAAADSIGLYVYCYPTYCDYTGGKWYSAYGIYPVDASNGCRDPPDVPGLNTLCMDWSHERAHFFFDGQPKRCLKMDAWIYDSSCSNSQRSCYASEWGEVDCTW